MPNNDQDKAFADILLENLRRVIDFLKYAEAKNGALLTFASAWVLAIIGILARDKPVPSGIGTAFLVMLPLLIGAGVLAMASFLPRINLASFLGGKRAGPHPKNLLYFGDIGSMTLSEFRQEVRGRYYPQEGRTVADEYVNDLIVQILANSRITADKLRFFSWGLALIGIATLCAVVPVIGWAIKTVWGPG